VGHELEFMDSHAIAKQLWWRRIPGCFVWCGLVWFGLVLFRLWCGLIYSLHVRKTHHRYMMVSLVHLKPCRVVHQRQHAYKSQNHSFQPLNLAMAFRNLVRCVTRSIVCCTRSCWVCWTCHRRLGLQQHQGRRHSDHSSCGTQRLTKANGAQPFFCIPDMTTRTLFRSAVSCRIRSRMLRMDLHTCSMMARCSRGGFWFVTHTDIHTTAWRGVLQQPTLQCVTPARCTYHRPQVEGEHGRMVRFAWNLLQMKDFGSQQLVQQTAGFFGWHKCNVTHLLLLQLVSIKQQSHNASAQLALRTHTHTRTEQDKSHGCGATTATSGKLYVHVCAG